MTRTSPSLECVRRWQSEANLTKSMEILSLLLKGRTSELCEVCGTHNGRCDMRGYHFPESTSDGKSYDLRGLEITLRRDVPEFKGVEMERTDFSYAVLNGTMWTRCEFTSCIADNAQFRKTMFYGSNFTDCHFNECDFRDTVLGGRYRHVNGTMQSTTFSGGRFSGVVFESPRVTDCRFDCNLHNVDFDGSQFMNCSFSGELDKVTFRHRQKDSGRLSKFTMPMNKMCDVDFSQAHFIDVDFRAGLELDKCIMPVKGDVVLITEAPEVFRRARAVVSSEWNGEGKRVALSYIEMFFDDLKRDGQRHFVLNGDMLRKVWGCELGDRFVSLMMEIQESSGTGPVLA